MGLKDLYYLGLVSPLSAFLIYQKTIDYETMDDREMDMPEAIRKIFNPSSNRISDLSRMGNGNDVVMSKEDVDIETEVI